MNITEDFINLILDFGEDWVVTEVKSDHKKEEVYLYLEYKSDYYDDPTASGRGELYDHTAVREYRHLDILHYKTYVRCRIPRVVCSDGKVKQIAIGWADKYARHTFRFEEKAIDVLQATQNQTATATLLKCGFGLVNRIIHKSTERGMARRVASKHPLENIGIDEKSFKKGHKYITVITHTRSGVVLDVGENRDSKSVAELLEKTFTQKRRMSIKTISMDMWKPYIKVAKTHLPGAEIVHDKFHLIAYLNKSIDAVRRREVKNNELLINSRYALLKNEGNMTTKQKEKFELIKATNLEVSKAWYIKENFRCLFDSSVKGLEVKELFVNWAQDSFMNNIKEVSKVVIMFLNHVNGVVNALMSTFNNAMAERLNGKIQEVKLRSRGYRTFKNFRSAILFFHGGLNLYPLRWQ
jgi:transposase